MENLFTMEMSAKQVKEITNLGLAHIGDGVYELMVRSYRSWACLVLISSPELNIGDSYTLTIGEKEIQTATITNSITNTGTAGMMPGMGQGRQGGMR